MPVGRPRKPTALKMLHGDDKVHPERMRRNEPQPKGIVEPPEHLSKPAREIWDSIAPAMIEARMLTPPDVPLAGELCEALVVARLSRLRAMQEASGRRATVAGAPSASASWARAMTIVISLGGRFGMTPADRARLDLGGTAPAQASDDLLSQHDWR